MERVVYRLGAYDTELLLPEVAAALKARGEALSREKMPGLWKVSDKLGKNPAKGGRSRILGILYLAMGLLLFLPGILNPGEMTLPMVAGAFAMVYGFGSLKKPADPDKRFRASAANLLRGKEVAKDPAPEVVFDGDGMLLPAPSGEERIAYGSFESAMLAKNCLLLVFGGRVLLLQRSHLAEGDEEALLQKLRSDIARFIEVS